MQALEKALLAISPLSTDVCQKFISAFQHWSVPKDHVLLREHQVSDYIYFLEKGVARIYYIKEGREVTEWVAMDNQFFLSITSFFQRSPSHLIIHTIEASEVWGIHNGKLMQLADEYHEVEKHLRKMVTASLILSQQRMMSIQFETAQQRYEKLLTMSPDIVQRVPLQYIASFLGITKESLSRIRGGR